MSALEPSSTDPSSGKTWSSVLLGQCSPSKTIAAPSKIINGTVHVHIPKDVLLESPPLWKAFVVGHFIGDSAPHIGKVHATVNRLWTVHDSKEKIDVHFISKSTVLFKIANDTIRTRVLRRQFWHISDIPMVVRTWTPSTADDEPNLSAIPLWVDFANVPDQLFSRRGLMLLGNSIGVAERLHPTTEKCTRFDVARVLVEVNLTVELPKWIDLGPEYKIVKVSFPWLPTRCSKCNRWGHQTTDCPKANANPITSDLRQTNETEQSEKGSVPVSNNLLSPDTLKQNGDNAQLEAQEDKGEEADVQLAQQYGKESESSLVNEVFNQPPDLNQLQQQLPNADIQIPDSILEQALPAFPGKTESHKKQQEFLLTPDMAQPHEETPNEGVNAQNTMKKPDPLVLTSVCNENQSMKQNNSIGEKRNSEQLLEYGEIQTEMNSPSATGDEENPPLNLMAKQGGLSP